MGIAMALAASSVDARDFRRADGRPLSHTAVDRAVINLMKAAHVTGLGLALIDDDKVAYTQAYGVRDAETGQPLFTDTILYGASLTKATFAYYVLMLVDDGRIDLDRPIADYLPKPLPAYPRYADLAGDERWRKLTFRILLNHTTGFQNFRWIDADNKLRFHRDPGARYGYSGEGINLAQFVLEQGLGIDIAAGMKRRIFDPLGMTRTSLIWQPEHAADTARGHMPDGKPVAYRQRSTAGAAGSMNTTVDDWSRFLAAAVRGEGLSAKARSEMTRPTILIDSETQFPTLLSPQSDRWKSMGLGYGVGWGVFDTRYGRAFFKEGHDDGTSNYALCLEARRRCVLFLSNDNRAEGIFVPLVERLLGPVKIPWEWEGYLPYDLPTKSE